ncbi:MAG TPA: PTS sugar transporter subunit IIA, partial [Deltaproteobacteria bacterium]|nr:PTS sugar transporter subunit IIA [Deltaproteobacteria bacterium]
HGKVQGLRDMVAVLGRSSRGLDFNAIDRKPCHIFFMLLAPSNSASQHLKALARASTLLKDPSLRQKILESSSSAEIYSLVVDYDSGLED